MFIFKRVRCFVTTATIFRLTASFLDHLLPLSLSVYILVANGGPDIHNTGLYSAAPFALAGPVLTLYQQVRKTLLLMLIATAATNSSTSPRLSSLPAELRNRIWRDALPDKDGPALYFYRKRCWCPRRLLKSDEGYDDSDEQSNLHLEFRHDLVDHV